MALKSVDDLTPEGQKNLSALRALLHMRQETDSITEAKAARAKRAGVKVLTDAEKAAFLASRPDLARD